jgi:hypothetical protein
LCLDLTCLVPEDLAAEQYLVITPHNPCIKILFNSVP